MQALQGPHDRNIAAGWHMYNIGEILYTDKVMVTLHHLYGPNGEQMRSGLFDSFCSLFPLVISPLIKGTWKGYMAKNSVGKVACK